MGIFPDQIQVEILASQVGQWSFQINLKTIKFEEWRSISKLSLQHTGPFAVELLHQVSIKRSFLFGFNINHRNKINMIHVLFAVVDDLHIVYVILHHLVEFLLIVRPA